MNKTFTRIFACCLSALLLITSACLAEDSNPAIDAILSAGTAQAFTDESVSDADLETILRAGLSATSAINQQPWYFAAVTDADVMIELAGSGFGGAPAGGKPEGMPEGFGGDMPDFAGGAPEGAPAMPAGVPAMGGGSAKAGMGDSPAAIIVYMNEHTSSPNAAFDCGLATQNMVIATSALGYGVKIVSSPTMTLNGADHDALCEKLGVPADLQAVAVLLIGRIDTAVDGAAGASVRDDFYSKVSIIK